MCGIFSVTRIGGGPISSEGELRNISINALSVIDHRGPDDKKVYIGKESCVSLGHVRLSIIDLVTGQQPLSSMDQKTHAVVNGEFYDYDIVRGRFLKEGYRFKTHSDSEILLPLYQKYGTNVFNHLRGEFAFCLWDESAGVFFAARDRFGVKPLYYTVKSGCLYVASEIKCLFAAGIEAAWGAESYATRAFYLGNKTLYKDIYQIPPGSFLLVKDGNIQIEKYWDMDFPTEENTDYNVSEEEHVLAVRESFEDSVKLRMRSDVDVGVYLSGGIDSSAVLSVASKYSQKPLDTFTLCFSDNDDFNERKYAEIAADHVSANFNPINVTEEDIADNFSSAIWHNEMPFFNGHGVAKYLLSKHVRERGIKVVLTGEGADEVFGGYPHYQRDMALFANDDPQYSEFDDLREKIINHEGSMNFPDDAAYSTVQSVLGYQPSWMQYQAKWTEVWSGFLNPEYMSKVNNNHPYLSFILNQPVPEKLSNRHPVHQSMYLWVKSYLPNLVLTTLGDRMEMANSIEGRLAFLDHHLIDIVNKIPANMKVKKSATKYILREALKPYLPEAICRRKKHYFRSPQALLTPKGKLYTLIFDVLNSNDFKKTPFFDHNKVTLFLDNLPKMSVFEQANYDGVLMELTSLALLQKEFGL